MTGYTPKIDGIVSHSTFSKMPTYFAGASLDDTAQLSENVILTVIKMEYN